MIRSHQRRSVIERDLAALADGSLSASRRIPVERAVSESSQLKAALAAQRRALSAVHRTLDEPTPAALRARLSLAHPPPKERVRPVTFGLLAVTAAGAMATVVAVSVNGSAGSASPTVVQASLVTVRLPQAPVNEPPEGRQVLPGLTGAGLTYPYLEDRFGYRAVGVRYDRLAGRRLTTVDYVRGSSRIAYEIVSGAPLQLGRAGQSTLRQGVMFRTLSGSQGQIVTWERDGHTCVLTSASAELPAMLRLASWRDGGRVPY